MTDDTQTKALAPIDVLRTTLDRMAPQFKLALPEHVTPERFVRTTMTAIQANPDLLECDRRSLLGACMKAAQDGLQLDGRDAALVIFNTKRKDPATGRDVWVKLAQYMPMIGGVLKKVRQSGELAAIDAQVVYEHDEFEQVLGDDPRIVHKAPPLGKDRGKAVGVYAIATLKNGEKQREVMDVAQVEQVRAISKAKDSGPWVAWWGEMARKTVLRRLSKRLPMSAELDEFLRRDDALYNLNEASSVKPAGPAPTGTPGRLLAAIGATDGRTIEHDEEPASEAQDAPQVAMVAEAVDMVDDIPI